MIFLTIILILFFLLIFFLAFLFLMTPLFSRVPFIPVRKNVLDNIISSLNLSNQSVLYDLGCGDGRILFSASKIFPGIKCIGIERAPFPYLCAKIFQAFSRNKKVSILYGNMFKKDISDATHIFVYLFPRIIDDLFAKFEKELKPGTRVVSCDFPFSKRQPNQIIELLATKHQLNKKLYIYDF